MEFLETELIVKEIRSFTQHNFWHPKLYHEDFTSLSNKGNHTKTNGPSKNPGMPLIVFDTSGLLQDTTLLPLCIEKLYHVLIPYTVLKELDGLKKTEYDKLRMKVVKTYGFLHDYSKSGCYYLHIENMFEASFGVKEFGCQNNDDIILKCVLFTTTKYTNERASVIFVTNDKSLTVKAVAHNIVTLNKNELLRLLTTAPQGSMNRPVAVGNLPQRMPFPKFSLHPPVPIRVSYQEIRNNLQPIFAHCSQHTFGPPMFAHLHEKEFFMPNNVFSTENRFQMPFWNLASTHIRHLPSRSSVEKASEMFLRQDLNNINNNFNTGTNSRREKKIMARKLYAEKNIKKEKFKERTNK
uniref:PIN domain-containing protein n=1 Tax=Setaria digitata TaxID=48799 RepID=A0A915PHK4_9BILA